MEKVIVVVINLDRRKDRMSFMSKKLESMNTTFERFSAIDALEKKNTWLAEGGISEITKIRMTLGEHAVHASHVSILKDASERNLDAVIVLEDDAVLSKDFGKLLDINYNELGIKVDIIKLESYYGEIDLGKPSLEILEGRYLKKLYSTHLGAAGYIVTRSGIEKLLKVLKVDSIRDPIDSAIFDSRSPLFKKLDTFQIDPAMVIQAELLNVNDELIKSDLSAGRFINTKNGTLYGDAMSFKRRFKRVVNRLRSRMNNRKRAFVRFSNETESFGDKK